MVGASRKRRNQAVVDALLAWYREARRDLPWRRLSNPYATWVSEIMLQQTQVATVVPYFERWIKRFPTIQALASAPEDDVLAAWQGLGYYSRARNLQRSAQLVREMHGGRLPSDVTKLRQLPGIGRYTAGAIASLAFNQPEPAVDGNVMRVLTRLEALRGDPRVEPVASQIWDLAANLVRCESPSQLNQALMELGALICIPDNPRCDQCPVLKLCRAQKLSLVSELPELPKRAKPEARRVVVLLVERAGCYLVAKQPESAKHWKGLYCLPYVELSDADKPLLAAKELLGQLAPRASLSSVEPLIRLTYPITRFRFEALVYRAQDTTGTSARQKKHTPTTRARYVSPQELSELALPAPHRRLFELSRSKH